MVSEGFRTLPKFAVKMEKNPTLSLRAIARDIGISQSYLSEVLKGKKTISLNRASELAKGLRLSRKETKEFRLLAQLEHVKDPQVRGELLDEMFKAKNKKPPFDLSIDQFKAIADWYHFAIRSLFDLDNFEVTPASIAKKLSINVTVAEAALERLLKLGVLVKNEFGEIEKNQEELVYKSDAPNKALRAYHGQMLDKAKISLNEQSPQEKFVGSETLAFNQDKLEEANEIIEEFMDKMKSLAEKTPIKKDVYHLGVQFFNLTRSK